MVIKQPHRPQGTWTGYMNFSPDLVSSDFAEPRAQSLAEQAGQRNASYGAKPKPRKTIAQQNVKTLSAATRQAPGVKRFALKKTEERVVQDQVNKKVAADRIKAAVKAKLDAMRKK